MDLSQALDIVYNGNTVSAVYLGQTKIWPSTPPVHDYSQDYLTFETIDDCKFRCANTGLYYSLDDGTTWESMGSGLYTPTILAGSKMLLKMTADNSIYAIYNLHDFESTGRYKVYGNILSVVYGDNYANYNTVFSYFTGFANMFKSSTNLITAENLILPNNVVTNMYKSMFNGCTGLTTPPALPATTLADYCYQAMFSGCTSLITAPALPATTLAQYCYAEMFSGCPFTTAPELPATTLAQGCYSTMFIYCRNIVNAPILRAPILTSACYQQMFQDCSSLNNVTCLATDISATNCIDQFLYLVAATGTFIKDANTTWPTGNNGIPSGWTVQNYVQ